MDNPNFYNNFPSNNYTFQNVPSNTVAPTPNSTYVPQPIHYPNQTQSSDYVSQPTSYIMESQCYVPQMQSYVSQSTIPGQGFIPTTSGQGFVPSTPKYVPPPPMPPDFVPPPPAPPAFFFPPTVSTPVAIQDTTSEISLQNPSEYSTNYSKEYTAQYASKYSSKRRYSKKSACFQKYTPNPTDQPQPTDYAKEYTSQYTAQHVNTQYTTELSTENPIDIPPESTAEIPFEIPVGSGPMLSDDDIVINIEAKLPVQENAPKYETISIVEVKKKICNLVLLVNVIKNKEKMLREQVSSLSDEEWTFFMEQIKKSKAKITETMAAINDSFLDLVRKRLTKRAAKRLRLKRARLERKRKKEERLREWKERSRKIDENLQKIQDDIRKAKMEEEAKLQADEVLKEVLRKKVDANKSIAKLDALVRLRKARKNTAKGRGETVSAMEETMFNKNIEKLKSLWVKKLAIYDKEETDLRAKLKKETDKQSKPLQGREQEVVDSLAKWKEFLFGGGTAQVNFHGDVETFIASRCAWDQFLCSEGTPLPIGWVVPTFQPLGHTPRRVLQMKP